MLTDLDLIARELDSRRNDGIDVRLLWSPVDDRCLVAVDDGKTGETFTIEVADGEDVLDVYHHPYAYAALRQRRREPVAA